MTSEEASIYETKVILIVSTRFEDILEDLNMKYEASTKNPMYSKNEMYWIGYIYAALSFLYDLSFKRVYKMFPAKEIVKYYNIYHTFDIEEAAERMMENIGYVKEDYITRGVKILKRLDYLDKLKTLIGKEVTVYIDRPLGSVHPKYSNTVYPINYGYIKEYIALDGEYQDAYVLGINKPLDKFVGTVIAIISRKDDIEDKLVITEKNKDYSRAEINKMVYFQEKYFRHKIIK